MSQPPSYTPNHSFVSDSAILANFPGQQLDVEFQEIKAVTDAIETNLALVQRDDGGLANGVVTYDSLSVSLQGAGLQPAVAWATSTAFAVGANVLQSSNLYRCLVAHTSGVFATDLTAGKWVLVGALAAGPQGTTGATGPANTLSIGTVSAGAAAATITGSAPTQTLNLTLQTGATGSPGNGYGGTSSTSLLIANSTSKTFTTQVGLAYQVGNYVRASSAANGINFMEGLVSSYSSTTLTIAVTNIGGSGTFADWVFAVSGAPGAGNVNGSGSSIVGNIPVFSNTSATAIVDSGAALNAVPGRVPTTATVTMTIAAPGVITWTAHGLAANAPVYLTTTGALPTGLTASNLLLASPTVYYVVGSSITANTFQLATTLANAKAGTAITTTGTQSGTHTAFANGWVPAGCIGEVIYKAVPIGSGVAMPTTTDTLWNSITLTAGIWKVSGQSGVIHASTDTPTFTHMHAGIGPGITGIPTSPDAGSVTALHVTSNNANGWIFPNKERVWTVTTSTAFNAVMTVDFTGAASNTILAYGTIYAERIG